MFFSLAHIIISIAHRHSLRIKHTKTDFRLGCYSIAVLQNLGFHSSVKLSNHESQSTTKSRYHRYYTDRGEFYFTALSLRFMLHPSFSATQSSLFTFPLCITRRTNKSPNIYLNIPKIYHSHSGL